MTSTSIFSDNGGSRMNKDAAYEELEITFSGRADIVYRHKRTLAQRLDSFAQCTTIHRYSHEALARAGFFWTGKLDQTLCFCCGGGIADWDENVNYPPDTTHQLWFPRCSFIRAYASAYVIVNDFSGPAEPSAEATATVSPMPHDLLCRICYDAKLSVLFRPCNHLASCLTCSDRLTLCPICRAEIREKIVVYL